VPASTSFKQVSSKVHRPKEKDFGDLVKREIINLFQPLPQQIKKYKLCFLSPSVVTADSSGRRKSKGEERQKGQNWASPVPPEHLASYVPTHNQKIFPNFLTKTSSLPY
jgi:hypothetical protein